MDKSSICIMALGLVGENDYSADSQGWKSCEVYFPQAYKELLAAHDWSFARRVVTLAKDDLGFRLPEDCMRVVELEGLRTWRICGRHIVDAGDGRAAKVKLWYTSNSMAQRGEVPDQQPKFVRCLVSRLAAYLAVPVGGDQNIRAGLEQEYRSLLDTAITDDVRQDGSNDQHPLDRIMNQSIVGGHYGA